MLPVAGATSRLGFLQAAGVGGKTPISPTATPKLAYRILGKTGLKVTTVGFGCMITSDPSVVSRAVDLGVNLFDTARTYQQGNNERMVGAALGAKRKQVVLSTKSHSLDKASLLKDLDTSLTELKTDYVDIWYLHGKDAPGEVHDDMIEAQQIALQQGKTRFRGLSTHSGQPALAPWIVEKGVFDVVLTAYNFAMDASMDQAIEALGKANIGIVGMKVMAGGSHGFGPTPARPQMQREGAMLSALKWVLNKPHIATTIPSMTDMDQLDENLRAMAEDFSPLDGKILAAHLEQIRPLYCHMCGECKDDCAYGLHVADVLRILTYADGYGQFGLARERFRELPAQQTAVRCADCSECTVNCPHGVHVAERLTRAQDLFA
jgi:predicted aldo/keto reductase-like oxidoreductase